MKPITEMLDSELGAVAAELEAEAARRVDAKVEAGAAIRVPLLVVADVGEDDNVAIARTKAIEEAKLRADGETREIHFGPPTIIRTGVPRPERPRGMDYKAEAESEPDRYPRARPLPSRTDPKPPLQEPLAVLGEWRRVRTQVKRPDPSKDYPGEIREAQYRLEGDLLRVQDPADGSTIGTTRLRPGDDAEVAAQKILREDYGKHGAFYGRISYPVTGIV